MLKAFDAIVAGAGIWGCTVARRSRVRPDAPSATLTRSRTQRSEWAGKKVLVLEKRAAVGGNCRCEIDSETGIEVHTYGLHIFHTSNEEVWNFVRRFTEFNSYTHSVLACTKKIGVENRCTAEGFYLYHLPIGKTLLEEFFGVSMKERNLREFLADPVDAASTGGDESGALIERALPGSNRHSTTTHYNSPPRTYGDAVFDAFIRGYTSNSRALLAKYQEEVDRVNGAFHGNAPTGETGETREGKTRRCTPTPSTYTYSLIIGGRLGAYKYFDMDKSIEAALKVRID